jgi:glycine dehydrogenase subunit 1
MPGRIVGITEDVDGKTGYVLTLQAREQHIRREKATSNICSNQALCALAATMSLCAFGKSGIKEMACSTTQKAHYAYEKLSKLKGVELVCDKPFFSEFVIKLAENDSEVLKELRKENILGGISLNKFYNNMKNSILVSLTELRTKNEIDYFVEKLGGILA